MSLPIIETERLILREFTVEDFDAVHSYASSRENTEYMHFYGPNTKEETLEFLRKSIAASNENPLKNYEYAAVLKANDALIGSVGIYDEGYRTAELGWILHRDYWHQGFAIEMARGLRDFAFRELDMHRLIAYCDAKNHGSYAVMEKLGMRREGHHLKSRYYKSKPDKGWCDGYCYAILKDEWMSQS